MFNPGWRGLVIAEKEDTALETFRRLVVAYEHLPPPIKVPLARPASMSRLEFAHDGLLSVVTGGGNNPAIGHSPDYAHITEYGEFEDYDRFNGAFFPAIRKRPSAKLRIETTPGEHGSVAHRMWLDCLEGRGSFAPVFLAWWDDDTCTRPTDKHFRRTSEEEKLAATMPGITDRHFQFRREALDTEFHGDTRLFDSKYPPSIYGGWITRGAPAIPLDALLQLADAGYSVPDDHEHVYEPREPQAPYLITADPAGFGEGGDPSAAVLWHGWDRREVACWSGRCDPGQLADRICRWQREWDADVIVESNKGECCEALLSRGCRKMHWSSEGQPGWYATETSKGAALSTLVDMLRRKEIHVRTLQAIHQLQTWDGRTRKRTGGHHFDRAVACVIAAYGFRALGYPLRPRERPVEEPPPGHVHLDTFLGAFQPRTGRNVLGEV